MAGNHLQGSLDIKGLENLTNLKELDLRWNGIESLESYKALDAFSSLRELYMRRTDLKFRIHEFNLGNLCGSNGLSPVTSSITPSQ
ncbi:hypothetical protein V6N13_047369 [Hibiscus sabdariffa]